MSGKMSRNKGQRGEREFIKMMQDAVDDVFRDSPDRFELKRNLFQTREGGDDVAGMPEEFDFVSVEIKFQEQLHLNKWWEQAVRQAGGTKIPVLAFRQSRQKWKVMLFTSSNDPYAPVNFESVISVEQFLAWYRASLRARYLISKAGGKPYDTDND